MSSGPAQVVPNEGNRVRVGCHGIVQFRVVDNHAFLAGLFLNKVGCCCPIADGWAYDVLFQLVVNLLLQFVQLGGVVVSDSCFEGLSVDFEGGSADGDASVTWLLPDIGVFFEDVEDALLDVGVIVEMFKEVNEG